LRLAPAICPYVNHGAKEKGPCRLKPDRPKRRNNGIRRDFRPWGSGLDRQSEQKSPSLFCGATFEWIVSCIISGLDEHTVRKNCSSVYPVALKRLLSARAVSLLLKRLHFLPLFPHVLWTKLIPRPPK
jgi:hypothetical protein